MSVESAIRRFRRKQIRQASDTVTVARPTGDPVTNSETGAVTQPSTEVYAGKAKIRPAGQAGRDVETGETELRRIVSVAKFPPDTDIHKDDIITVTASRFDATMVGRQYRAVEHPGDGWQIAKTVLIEEVLVPQVLDAGGS